MNSKTEPFWNTLVSSYFRWYNATYKTIPVFKGSAPRDLRLIVAMLHEHFSSSWNENYAVRVLHSFLQFAHDTEPYLRDHWSLAELYKMKEGILSNFIK